MRLLIFLRKRGIFVILEILPGRFFLIIKEEDQGIKMSSLCTFYRLLSFTKKGSEYVPMGEYKSDKLSIGGSDSCQVSCPTVIFTNMMIKHLYRSIS
jgi:hypothetical protein